MTSRPNEQGLKRARTDSDAVAHERKRLRSMTTAEVAAEIMALRERIATLENMPRAGATADDMGSFPVELLPGIFQWLTQPELLTRVALVCQTWHETVNTRLVEMDFESGGLYSNRRMKKYTRLEVLSLVGHYRVDHILPTFTCSRLRTLNITDCRVDSLAFLLVCTALQTLSLGTSTLAGEQLQKLPPTLTSLTLTWCTDVKLEEIVNLRGLTRLEHLTLSNLGEKLPYHYDSPIFLPMELAATLRTLKICGINCYSGECLSLLYRFRALETLCLYDMLMPITFMDAWATRHDIAPLDQLTHLAFDNMRTGVDLRGMARVFPNIHHLEIRRTRVDNVDAISTLRQLEMLEYQNSNHAAIVPYDFLRRCQPLRQLHIIHGHTLTAFDLVAMALAALSSDDDSNLETLVLGDCLLIAPDDLIHLRAVLPKLVDISEYSTAPRAPYLVV